jgi:hypothetical protein
MIAKSGISRRTVGNMLFVRKIVMKNFRPLNRYRENAYAARRETARESTVVSEATKRLFSIGFQKLYSENNLL